MKSALPQDVREVLALAEEAGGMDIDQMTVEEARRMHEAFAMRTGDDDLASVRDDAVPGPAGDVPVRVYTPAGEPPFPVVVYFHGGGFVVGSPDTHDLLCRRLAEAAGAVLVSVDYRLAPEHPFPAAVEDAVAATEWVAGHAADLDADPGRLAVAGDSAGGTLAAVTCLWARDHDGPSIAAQALVYPATAHDREFPSMAENAEGYFLTRDAMEWFGGHYLDSEIHGHNPYAFPLSARDLTDLPPATVITAGFDPLRDEGIAYADRLAEAGVPVTHRHYEDMIHGFVSMLAEPADVERAHEAVDDLATDLREAFGE